MLHGVCFLHLVGHKWSFRSSTNLLLESGTLTHPRFLISNNNRTKINSRKCQQSGELYRHWGAHRVAYVFLILWSKKLSYVVTSSLYWNWLIIGRSTSRNFLYSGKNSKKILSHTTDCDGCFLFVFAYFHTCALPYMFSSLSLDSPC